MRDMSDDIHDVSRKAQIDRHLSHAHVYRMRGEYVAAEDAYREALALDETRLDVRELIADMLYARGKLDASAEEYRTIIDERPGSVSVETKYAKTVLEIGEREHEKAVTKAIIDNPDAFQEHTRRPVTSMLLSACAPGFGQVYNGEIVKGAIIIGAFVVSLLVLAFSPKDVENLFRTFGAMVNPRPGTLPPISSLTILFVSAALFIWIYAVIDAPISADKLRSKDSLRSTE